MSRASTELRAAGAQPELGSAVGATVGWGWWLLRVVVVVAFAWAKFQAFFHSRPLYAGDDNVWLSVAYQDFWSTEFFHAHRPFFVPLIHKLLGLDETAVVWFQGGLAVLSWGALAWVISLLPRSAPARLVALLAPLSIDLLHPVHGWDFVIRSESISMSLTALLVALAVIYLRAGQSRRIWAMAMLAVGVALIFTRDTNFIFVIGIGLWLVAVDAWFKRRRRPQTTSVILAGAFIVAALVGHANAQDSRRHVGPMMNVIFQRVLNHWQRLAEFRDELGMPVNRALLERRGKWHSQDDHYAFKEERLEEFRRWLRREGLSQYRRYVLGHLAELGASTLRVYPTLMNDRFPRYAGTAPSAASTLSSRLWFEYSPFVRWPRASLALGTVLSVVLFLFSSRRARRLAALGVFFFGATGCMLFAGYVGDAMEVIRHSVVAVPLVALGGVCTLVAAIEGLGPKLRRAAYRLAPDLAKFRCALPVPRLSPRVGSAATRDGWPTPASIRWAAKGISQRSAQRIATVGLVLAWSIACTIAAQLSPHQQLAGLAKVEASSVARGEPELVVDGEYRARFCTAKEGDPYVILDLGTSRKLRRLVLMGLKQPTEVAFSRDGKRYRAGLQAPRASARIYHLDRVKPARRARFIRLRSADSPKREAREREKSLKKGKRNKATRRALCLSDVRIY